MLPALLAPICQAIGHVLVHAVAHIGLEAVYKAALHPYDGPKFDPDNFVIPNDHDPIAAVVSSHEPCSKIGNDILRRRGNAADAAIAMAVCIGTVAPYHSGIGGGGMALVLDKGRINAFDFRETAPDAATQAMFEGNETSGQIGGLAVGVPGEVAGLQLIYDWYASKWEDLGTTWRQLWNHSATIAKEGFKMTEDMRHYYDNVQPSNKFLLEAPWSTEFTPNGSIPQVGETIHRPVYAKTLNTIAKEGAQAFYKGPIAESIVQTVNKAGGILTTEDLEIYKPTVRTPISMRYRGYRLFTTPAPSSAVSVFSALQIMHGYPPMNVTNQNETTHTLVEAIKHAYGMRTKLGDPALEGTAIFDAEKMMTDPENIESIRKKIKTNQTFNDGEYYNPQALITRDTQGTAHISVADQYGMVVALTTTVNMYFGAQLMDPETGIILNNEMNDFNNPLAKWEEPAGASDTQQKKPSPANFIKPGKRPLSSMSPIIAFKSGKFAFSLGAAGGAKIITSVLQTCINLIDRQMNMYNAIKEPRLHHQLTPNELQLETSFDPKVAAYLKDRGHEVKWVPEGRSVVHGISVNLHSKIWQETTIIPACDPRKCKKGAWIMDRVNDGRVVDHPVLEDWLSTDPINLPEVGDNQNVPYNVSLITLPPVNVSWGTNNYIAPSSTSVAKPPSADVSRQAANYTMLYNTTARPPS